MDTYNKVFMPIGRFICKDGSSLSIQAGSSPYSEPREDGADEYTKVEVGFPIGRVPDSWADYAESYDTEEQSQADIYAFLPIELVEEFITLHGGVDFGRTIAALRARSTIDLKRY